MERIEILMPFESKDLTTGFRMTGKKTYRKRHIVLFSSMWKLGEYYGTLIKFRLDFSGNSIKLLEMKTWSNKL